jgi:hypothetical protein
MKGNSLLMLIFLMPALLFAQKKGTSSTYKKVSILHAYVKNTDQIHADIPSNWKVSRTTILDEKGMKMGELAPGVLPDCHYKSGADFIKELQKGYPDDPATVQFISSRTLSLKGRTWTEGIRKYKYQDKEGLKDIYSHTFFAFFDKKCFKIAFTSYQPKLKEEAVINKILSSIEVKGRFRN